METTQTSATEYTATTLSSNGNNAKWCVTLFAYNEARNIIAALDSIQAAAPDQEVAIYVIANGCQDATAEIVKAHAGQYNQLTLIECAVADKANAWNLFVQDVLTDELLEQFELCFFMDGDVTLSPQALSLLATSFVETPRAEAAGAMPATGRDRDAWRGRMVRNNMLAGNCYALRSAFVKHLRARNIRMPIGLIGEDFFVSWLVSSNAWRKENLENEGIRCVFNGKAEFSFKSLSPFRLSHYRTYLRRNWRYTLREIQHPMVVNFMERGLGKLPHHMDQLYLRVPSPPGGGRPGMLNTLLHMYAKRWIQAKRNNSSSA